MPPHRDPDESSPQRDPTELLEALVRSSPLALIACDRRDRVLLWSPAAERIFGERADQAIGRPFELGGPEHRDEVRRLREEVLRGTPLEGHEAEHPRPDGTRVIVSLSCAPLRDARGELSGSISLVEDITHRKEREAHLRRAERLASLPTLVGGVAHELNNPLTAIKSFTQLLLMDEHSPDDREALEIIQREADRASRVVSDLRQLVRDGLPAPPGVTAEDLNEVVRHVVRLREYSLRTRNIEPVLELAEDLPPVRADRRQLEQVVLNLMDNAAQALEQHEGTRLLKVRTHPSPRGVCLRVADTGPGIPPEHLGQIFDPFFTTREPGQGMGLGLSLVHTIVSRLGGEVHVESEPGRGATFRVELPTEPPAAPTRGRAAARAARVLVVDDEAPVRLSIRRYLERLGHTVEEAEDGASALRHLAEEEYDVILSDLRMPGMDGEALLRRLRRDRPELVPRVAFLTGDVAGRDVARFMQTTDHPVLLKPFDLGELARLVERLHRPPG